MKKILIGCIVSSLVLVPAIRGDAAPRSGDQIVVKDAGYTGSFEGYEKDTFSFRKASGELLTEPRKDVSLLEVKEPCEAELTLSGKKKSEMVRFKKYDKLKFTFQDDKGKEKSVPAHTIESIMVPREPDPQAVVGRADMPVIIPAVDLTALENKEDLSPRQTAVIEEYKAANAAHRQFIDESTILVKKMDGAKGARREDLLNQLRSRKQDEQPLKNALVKAKAELLATFPQLKP